MRNLLFLIGIILIFAFLVFSIFTRGQRKKIKAVRVIAAILAIAALFCIWEFPAYAYPEPTGEFNVASVGCTYVDENRVEPYEDDGSARWLNVVFWYPENYIGDDHTCPLIVFSHGSFGIKESNESLYRELASHGYIVCAIDHTYQCLNTVGPDGKTVPMSGEYRKQIMAASDSSEEGRQALFFSFTEWMHVRMGDINFVLDTVIARSDANDGGQNGVYLLADTTKIGVMGHSLGGAAALGMGRVRGDVKAVIALEAPFMNDVHGVKGGAFVWEQSPYPVPLLSVYTDSSWDKLASLPQYAQNDAVLHDQCDTTYDLYVQGAGHMTLTDLAYSMPVLCLAFGQDMFFDIGGTLSRLNQSYLDFFDYYLKDDTQIDLNKNLGLI